MSCSDGLRSCDFSPLFELRTLGRNELKSQEMDLAESPFHSLLKNKKKRHI